MTIRSLYIVTEEGKLDNKKARYSVGQILHFGDIPVMVLDDMLIEDEVCYFVQSLEDSSFGVLSESYLKPGVVKQTVGRG